MPLPMTPAPSTPILLTVRGMSALLVGKLDAGQPQAGSLELSGSRQHLLALPQAVEALGAGALDHAGTERLALLVVLAVELQAEEPLHEPLGLAPLEPVTLHRLVDLGERRDQGSADALEDGVGVTLEHRGERLDLPQHLRLAR